MKLLIVDDEKSMIDALEKNINWEVTKCTERFHASNIGRARDLIETEDISILLCDIEMPFGSGLELVEWVKENHSNVVCILVTCHSEFSMAQKALRAGCYDYVLKPVDFWHLEKVLINAVGKVAEQKTQRLRDARYEINSQVNVKQFWKNLIGGNISPTKDSVERYLGRYYLDLPLDTGYTPVMICPHNPGSDIDRDDLMLYGLRNIAEEIFSILSDYHCVEASNGAQIVVVRDTRAEVVSDANYLLEVKMCCNKLADAVAKYLDMNIICYIGAKCALEDIPLELKKLEMMDSENIYLDGPMLTTESSPAHKSIELQYTNEHFHHWEHLSAEGYYERVKREIIDYLSEREAARDINKKYIRHFRQDFVGLIFAATKGDSTLCYQLFDNELAVSYSAEATNSVKGLCVWIAYTLDELKKLRDRQLSDQTILEQVERYVSTHISEEILVTNIANEVHLNASYLSRLFKKETGILLNKYIANKKVETAKWFLKNTDSSIGDIAAKVGYFNYSSFHRSFAKIVGMSPQEYKRLCKIEEETAELSPDK